MPLLGSFELESGKTWGYYFGSNNRIYDTFQRSATSGTLGTSTDGEIWNTLRGSWYCNGVQAYTTTTSSGSYPLAVYNIGDANQLAYANISNGMGISFWVTDANNWWGLVAYQDVDAYTCGCSSCPVCNVCQYCSSNGVSCSKCGSNCGQPPVNCCECCLSYVTGANCTACGSTPRSCNCSTCYNYYNYLQIVNNTGGSITEVGNPINLSLFPSGIALQTVSNSINYVTYSTIISGTITTIYGLGTVIASGTVTISGYSDFGPQLGIIGSTGFYGTYPPVSMGQVVNTVFGTGE